MMPPQHTVMPACRTTCVEPFCGDGAVDDGEECDDGNQRDGDGCDADCFVEEVRLIARDL